MPGLLNGPLAGEELHLAADRYYDKRDKQRQDLVDLIERFYHQVRYGCQSPACCVSTCRSCRDRLAGPVPYRVPTPLTARAIASFLASLNSPQDHLCPHPPRPKTDEHDLAFSASKTLTQLNDKLQKDLKKDDSILGHWLGNSEELAKLIKEVKDVERRQCCERNGTNATDVSRDGTETERDREASIDIKSFAQKLFSTTSWRLASLIETFRGRYRMLPPFSYELYNNSINLSIGNPATDLKDHFTVHPRIGIYKVPKKLTLQSDRSKPYSYTKFGQLIVVSYGLKLRRQLMDTGRTSPLGPEVLLDSIRIDSQTESAMRMVPEVLGSTSAILEYAREPSTSNTMGSRSIRTVALGYLVQEFVVLLNAEQEPRAILPSLTECVQSLRCVPDDAQMRNPAVAAHIVNIALAALVARLFIGTVMSRGESWAEFIRCRQQGYCLPHHLQKTPIRKGTVELMAAFQDDLALDLARAVFRTSAEHNYRASIYLPRKSVNGTGRFHSTTSVFMINVVRFLKNGIAPTSSRQMAYGRIMLEWARSIFLEDWNGSPEFTWSSDLGCAIDFMCQLYENRATLCFEQSEFEMPVLYDRIDFLEVAKQWMLFDPSARQGHLLDYPWLFTPSALVTFFRSINIMSMFKAYEKSVMVGGLLARMGVYIKTSQRRLLEQLRVSTMSFLVLEIRRDNILGDALNQLWRRQKRELTRPLKVRMGMDEGEEGFDLGGVQQEFFRLAVAEALDPTHGLFTIDEVTRMTWFVPCSGVPLYQYVLIGLLFGLAVYNGLTLPVTFPLVFYRKLLEIPFATDSLISIMDGWPTLAKSFAEMLQFQGSVEDVYVRQYVFSFESNAMQYDIDMQKQRLEESWPPQNEKNACEGSTVKMQNKLQASTPSQDSTVGSDQREATFGAEDGIMVTNKNRRQYVSDYIRWLVDKSIAPEYGAFATGFYLPLQKKSLELFSPEAFRTLIEGVHEIDIEGLRRVTTYEDGYHPQHRCIRDFWSIVREFSLEEKKLLLEFVTASERVPVRGIQEMTFIVLRHGDSDERLPASSTCFSRLLLPEYSTKEIMEKKLRLAIVNNRGFGYQ